MAVLNKLTPKQVSSAKPQEKPYSMADGGGLVLLIQPNGSKWWRFRYRFAGLAKMISFGVYPDVPLAKQKNAADEATSAREMRDHARKLLAAGVDPSAARQAKKSAVKDTFKAVAEEFLAQSDANSKTVATLRRRFDLYIYPRLAKRPVSEITTHELRQTLKKVQDRGTPETARRLRIGVGQVFKYAIGEGRASHNPADALKGVIKAPKKKHHSTILEPKKIGGLMRAIDGYDGHPAVAAALRLAPLVFVRPGELRHAEWEEFDLDTAEWRIPGSKTKTGKPLVVPLSTQALAILTEIQALTGPSGYVFPSIRTNKRPMSENSINSALRRLGYGKAEMSGHGFRSMASSSLHGLGFNSDWIERQLGHVERNVVKDAYNFAEHLPERTKMMQSWSDFLDSLKSSASVTAIGKAKAHA